MHYHHDGKGYLEKEIPGFMWGLGLSLDTHHE